MPNVIKGRNPRGLLDCPLTTLRSIYRYRYYIDGCLADPYDPYDPCYVPFHLHSLAAVAVHCLVTTVFWYKS